MAALALLLCCAAARADEQPVEEEPPAVAATGQAAWQSLPAPLSSLLSYALEQDGVPYRRGGTSAERGFDCSGFVRNVFEHAEGVMLPHSAKALSLLGEQIAKTDLQPGDLVFFRIVRHSISHVGIYLGDNRFIHASSRRTGGVRVSDLADRYWVKRFTLARRLELPAAETAAASAAE